MKQEQILKQVIEKAVKGGWGYFDSIIDIDEHGVTGLIDEEPVWIKLTDFIFDHSFAKAFWGEDLFCPRCGDGSILEKEGVLGGSINWRCDSCEDEWVAVLKEYEYRLQQLVIAKDRLKYLSKFL